MSTITKDLGAVTAYACAKEKGYTGTEAEFAELMASYATVAQQASQSAQTATEKAQQASASATSASQSADTASASATSAQASATTATAKASEAQQSATTATTKAQEASQGASTATSKASEAAQSASDATTAKTAAQTAQTAAEGSATTAQTAAQTATQKAAEAAESARTLTIDPTLTESGQAADAKKTGDEIASLKNGLSELENALEPLGLVSYVCKYPSGASGYQNVPFTLPAGDYKVTVAESNSYIRFIDANSTNVIDPVSHNAVNYPITLTSEQASALAYLRMANSGVVHVYPAETILDDIDSIQSEVNTLASNLNNLTGDTLWITSSNFEQGTLYVLPSDNSIKKSSNTKRVRQKISTARHLTPSSNIFLSDYSHYKFLVLTSTDNGITWTQGAWITSGNYVTTGDSTIYLILLEDTTANTADVDTLVNLIQYDEAGTFIKEVDTKLKNISGNPYFAHLSFDDVQYCMIDLKNNADSYDSIFDNPFFAMLKNLHDVYGAVISLYLFITNTEGGISAYPTKFANEFTDNADWLKFGLHQGGTNYANTSAETALSDYNAFTSNIINIGGTVNIIDRCPRLGNFAGNLNSMLAMRDANGGIVGLLSAYDTRDSYYLDSTDSAYLFSHGKLVDEEHHLTFYRTIKTFEVANPATELPKLQTLSAMNGAPYGIIMMHEYSVYGSDFTLDDSMKSRLEYACAWLVNNGYAWDYPMNRIF